MRASSRFPPYFSVLAHATLHLGIALFDMQMNSAHFVILRCKLLCRIRITLPRDYSPK